jgi:hypothetical protein
VRDERDGRDDREARMKRARVALAVVVAVAVTACRGPTTTPEAAGPPMSAPHAGADAGAGADAEAHASADAGAGADAAAGAGAEADASAESLPEPSFREVLDVLFADRASTASVAAACPESLAQDARIRCLYDERYKGDAKAAGLAHEMLVRWRTVAGVETAHTMDGGYRGMIHLVPTVPTAHDRKHLEWIVMAMRDFDRFFAELDRYGRDHAVAPGQLPYRFRALTVRFMRSTNTNRPSAYAHDWTIAYNVLGSINLDADRVRETMFHEVFHLNDAARGLWSARALAPIFDAVVRKCGTKTPCLAPYSPGDTMVRGGTYYSFQPGNGVVEYAAELALRYYREQRAALRSLDLHAKAFKCGPPENARAWAAMKDEFFAGIDATPACP